MATAATVVRTKPKAAPRPPWRCNFCQSGHHGSCPGALWTPDPRHQGAKTLWVCECGRGHRERYCLACKNERTEDVGPLWNCLDPHACAARVQARLNNSALWQMLQRCKSQSANRRKLRDAMKNGLKLDPEADAEIDNKAANMGTAEFEQYLYTLDRRPKPGRPRKTGTTKAKSNGGPGVCECCGQPTRGGRFLPGHDAKLASALKQRVAGPDYSVATEAWAEIVRRGWQGKVPAAIRSQWENREDTK